MFALARGRRTRALLEDVRVGQRRRSRGIGGITVMLLVGMGGSWRVNRRKKAKKYRREPNRFSPSSLSIHPSMQKKKKRKKKKETAQKNDTSNPLLIPNFFQSRRNNTIAPPPPLPRSRQVLRAQHILRLHAQQHNHLDIPPLLRLPQQPTVPQMAISAPKTPPQPLSKQHLRDPHMSMPSSFEQGGVFGRQVRGRVGVGACI